MSALAALLLAVQAGAPAAAPVAAPPPDALRPASPRTLSGRFTCGATVCEVTVTSATGQPTRFDRLAVGGRPVDAGSLAEASRKAAPITDVQSVDVRCRDAGAELSLYGLQRQQAASRRARLRGEWRGARVEDVTLALMQR